jgi:DNA polymerase-3 subunit gamma/tau
MKDKAQVFYRKFRPQLLSDVVGQEHVTRTLLNALAAGHTSHAYLFCGPRGTGKTSTGRILAKAVNCARAGTGGKGEPCNKCSMCKAITEGSALDVIEIDAASHTGVDDVRDLIEKVNYSPAEARNKVYIVDEAHMLSTAASNALLKTLEEPPPHIMFILATTENHKMLPTIVSRCQRFDFKRLSYRDIEEKLNRICQSENITIAPAALRVVAKSARGGLRDAENLLEQLFTYYGDNLELAQVQELLGMGGGEQAKELLRHLVRHNIAGGLSAISQAQNEGLNLKHLDREIIGYLRQILLIKSGCDKELDLTSDEISELKELAAELPLDAVLRSVRLFGQIEAELANDSTLPLEMALVEACMEPARQSTAAPLPAPASRPANPGPEPFKKREPAPSHPSATSEPPSNPRAAPVERPRAARTEAAPVYSVLEGAGSKLEQLVNNWGILINQAPENIKKSPAAAILRSAGVKPVAFDNDTVVLTFRYPYHKEKIEETENRKVVAELISRFTGEPCQIKCIYEPAENHLVREAQKMGAQIINVEE